MNKVNTIVRITGLNKKYILVDRTSFMGEDYYLGFRLDRNGDPMPESEDIIHVDSGEKQGNLAFEDFEDGEEIVCFVRDMEMEKMLWMLFEEQMELE